MSDTLNIPSLLRQVRKAVSQENYEEAVRLYKLIIQDPEMESLLDTKTRYAFCVEKTGDLSKAIELYQNIVEIYKDSGEAGAAKALELKISILQSLMDKKTSPNSILDESEESIQNIEEASLAFMNYLDLSDGDLNPNNVSSQQKPDKANDFMDFLSLGTQDFSIAEEETQKIPSMSSGEDTKAIDGDLEHQETHGGDLSASDESSLIDMEESKVSVENREIINGLEEVDEDDLLDAAAFAVSSVPKMEVQEQSEGTDKAEEPEEVEPQEELNELKALIQAGIKSNRINKNADPSLEMALTSIGNHKLELVDPNEKFVAKKSKPKRKMDQTLVEKSAKLFGEKNKK